MRKSIVLLLVMLLPVVGGGLGRAAAPVLARTHYVVRLADQIRLEAGDNTVERTLESDAFRAQAGKPKELYAEAAAVEKRFALGGVILGVYCGLVFAFVIFGLHRTRRREIYEINYDACLACTRCFRACPREKARLEELREGPAEEEAA